MLLLFVLLFNVMNVLMCVKIDVTVYPTQNINGGTLTYLLAPSPTVRLTVLSPNIEWNTSAAIHLLNSISPREFKNPRGFGVRWREGKIQQRSSVQFHNYSNHSHAYITFGYDNDYSSSNSEIFSFNNDLLLSALLNVSTGAFIQYVNGSSPDITVNPPYSMDNSRYLDLIFSMSILTGIISPVNVYPALSMQTMSLMGWGSPCVAPTLRQYANETAWSIIPAYRIVGHNLFFEDIGLYNRISWSIGSQISIFMFHVVAVCCVKCLTSYEWPVVSSMLYFPSFSISLIIAQIPGLFFDITRHCFNLEVITDVSLFVPSGLLVSFAVVLYWIFYLSKFSHIEWKPWENMVPFSAEWWTRPIGSWEPVESVRRHHIFWNPIRLGFGKSFFGFIFVYHVGLGVINGIVPNTRWYCQAWVAGICVYLTLGAAGYLFWFPTRCRIVSAMRAIVFCLQIAQLIWSTLNLSPEWVSYVMTGQLIVLFLEILHTVYVFKVESRIVKNVQQSFRLFNKFAFDDVAKDKKPDEGDEGSELHAIEWKEANLLEFDLLSEREEKMVKECSRSPLPSIHADGEKSNNNNSEPFEALESSSKDNIENEETESASVWVSPSRYKGVILPEKPNAMDYMRIPEHLRRGAMLVEANPSL
eukprot:PhF_6_TR25162/c0_g1_i1/m.34681